MRLLLLTPPMTQLNTPYPATAYITGFLKTRPELAHIEVSQADPAIELVLRLLCRTNLRRVADQLSKQSQAASVRNFLSNQEQYLNTVEPTLRFLQGRDPSLATRIAAGGYLPEGPRFRAIHELAKVEEDPLGWAFGALGSQDRAKYLASLYLDDLADVIRDGVDPRFTLSRYGEKLASSAASFEPLHQALKTAPTLVDELLSEITRELIEQHRPDVVGFTAPFPGNVYGAFRMAQDIKRWRPETKTILGGGYVNTELRSLKEIRVFDYFDFITLDDGERPLLCLLEHLQDKRSADELKRTFIRQNNQVVLKNGAKEHDIPQGETGAPSYVGLPLDRYLSICEMLNPMHRLWSDGRWNKLTLAHGCYWKQCNFCDVTLDYIERYEETKADELVDRIEALVKETGQTGFHFVDEAAPPKVLFALAQRLIARGVTISWWGNVRFEKTFTPKMAKILADSGCVAISGGLEVASDRLLKLMNKGVTVEQVARVTKAFTDAGVLVHAYLMYGFPTQTAQETVDALERVRQLFVAGCIQSAFWHRFAATVHSPIGKNPERFGIKILPMPPVSFAENDLDFEDPTDCDHDALGIGLNRALYNFMHGIGLAEDVRSWFDVKVPKPKVPRQLIDLALSER